MSVLLAISRTFLRLNNCFCRRETRPPDSARYISKLETPTLALEVAFFGGAEKAGSANPEETQVVARCLKKANCYVPKSPWIETWTKSFGDLTMPSGAWNGIKLVEIHGNRAFLGISNHLMEIDIESGRPKWSVVTGNTPVYQVMSSQNGENLIVFNGGNIVAIDFTGNEIWRSELPSEDDFFANPPYFDEGTLKSASWKGFTCSIDQRTGKILEREFTK